MAARLSSHCPYPHIENFDLEQQLDSKSYPHHDTPSDNAAQRASPGSDETWEWGSENGMGDNDDICGEVDGIGTADKEAEDMETKDENHNNLEYGPCSSDPHYQFCPPAHCHSILCLFAKHADTLTVAKCRASALWGCGR